MPELSTDVDARRRRVPGMVWGGGVTLLTPDDVVGCPVALILASDVPHADRAARSGVLVRLARGVYAGAAAYRDLPPWSRYLARVHAVALAWPDAIFVLESAAVLRGLPIFGEPADVHILVAAPHKARAQRGIRVHSAERMPVIERVGAVWVASVLDTVVDIARLRHPAVGLAVACAALRADPELTVAEVEKCDAHRLSKRGRRRGVWVYARATATPESPLEAVSLAVIEWLGFPSPELQKWILGPTGVDDDRVDFWWERWRIAGEADGAEKYSGERGDARAALRARNRRDARLADRGVTATAHWAWDDIIAHEQLRALLRAAGLPLTGPKHGEPLRTLAAALRPAPPTSTRRNR